VRRTALLLVLAGTAGGPLLAAPPPLLVRYSVSESVHAVTPRGERDQALKGTVSVAGARALWRVTAGTFPRSVAAAALAEEGGITLLDPKEKQAARVREDEFAALFDAVPQAAAGGATYRDVEASVVRDGAGRPFQDRPTSLYHVSFKYTLSLILPGRVTRVTSVTAGTIETLELPDAGSPFDDLLRLFSARGEARPPLKRELDKVSGLPVRVRVESVAETSFELTGPPAAPSAEHPARPLKTTTRTERTLSELVTAPFAAADSALFVVPEDYRTRGIERLVTLGNAFP
jgi:hypothetical protein